jgi:hypothetical protein
MFAQSFTVQKSDTSIISNYSSGKEPEDIYVLCMCRRSINQYGADWKRLDKQSDPLDNRSQAVVTELRSTNQQNPLTTQNSQKQVVLRSNSQTTNIILISNRIVDNSNVITSSNEATVDNIIDRRRDQLTYDGNQTLNNSFHPQP